VFPRSPVALREWAVVCDALARGEQIFVLRDDLPLRDVEDEAPDRGPAAATDGDGGPAGEERAAGGGPVGATPADRADALLHEEFWLWPEWEDQRAARLTDPYRDRKRSLDELRHRDGRVRLAYYATIEYVERITDPGRLLALDGEHALNARAVEQLTDPTLLVLRVWRRPEAALVARDEARPGAGPWVRLPDPVPTEEAEAVVADERFLSEKARILRRAGSVRAV